MELKGDSDVGHSMLVTILDVGDIFGMLVPDANDSLLSRFW